MKKITEEQKEILIAKYEEGKMDTEIAKELGITRSAVGYWRKKLNLRTKFDYSKISKIDNIEFEKLFNLGLSDYAIAKKLNMSPDGVYSHRIRHNYIRTNNLRLAKEKEALTDLQKQILLGTLLGDASLIKGKHCINPYLSCAHSIKQKEYCEYKTSFFENIGATCTYHKRKIQDKRNGKYYEDYTMRIPTNLELSNWYSAFYKNNKKCIPFELFEYFTPVSLAFMFMDDGCKINQTYAISTNCFSKEELLEFRKFLFNKFNIETSLFKSNVLYIKKCSSEHFTNLISPYICKCMKYKLQVS